MLNTPNIRFKGFTEPWEQRKLGEVAGRTYGGGTPKTAVVEYWNGNIPWIQSSNLTEHELFNPNIQKYITDEGLSKSAAQLVPPNSIAVVSHVGVGKLVFMPFSYTTSQDFISLSELKAEPTFTCYSIYKRLQNDIHIVQGSAIKGITKNDLLSKEILLPSEPEQAKIGMYFCNLDHLITLHQCMYNEMSKLKKFMLQKMFPKNGEQFPEIRFNGFTEPWEQRKLGEVVTEVKRIDENSDAPVMMITANEGFINQSERYSNNNAGQSLKKYIVLEKGELAYNHGASKLRPYGSCFALMTEEKARIPFVYHCFVTHTENAEFLSITLNGKSVERQLRRIVSSGVRMDGLLNISFEEYTSIPVVLPSVAEQNQIAKYFCHLDHLITLHQRKCDEFKEIKKYMLQNMFPQKG